MTTLSWHVGAQKARLERLQSDLSVDAIQNIMQRTLYIYFIDLF